MKSLIQQIDNPISNVIIGMINDKKYCQQLYITDESRYFKLLRDLKELTESKYISISRRGQKVELKILKKGQVEKIS